MAGSISCTLSEPQSILCTHPKRESPDELVLRRKKKQRISSEERVYLSIDMGNRGVHLVFRSAEVSASHSLAFFLPREHIGFMALALFRPSLSYFPYGGRVFLLLRT
jgi:hypothetical protein